MANLHGRPGWNDTVEVQQDAPLIPTGGMLACVCHGCRLHRYANATLDGINEQLLHHCLSHSCVMMIWREWGQVTEAVLATCYYVGLARKQLRSTN